MMEAYDTRQLHASQLQHGPLTHSHSSHVLPPSSSQHQAQFHNMYDSAASSTGSTSYIASTSSNNSRAIFPESSTAAAYYSNGPSSNYTNAAVYQTYGQLEPITSLSEEPSRSSSASLSGGSVPNSHHSSPLYRPRDELEQQQPSQSFAEDPAAIPNGAMLKSNVFTTGPAILGGTPLSRPLTHREEELLSHLDRLKYFLATAPSRWSDADFAESDPMAGDSGSLQRGTPLMPHPNTHPALNRFLLPSGEYVTCVLWSGLYHITGTDIVRALVFRFEAFGRPVRNMKKFEEGVFSDLRNLKPGIDACLEEPKSPFLDLLFKYQCIRTQKKQKVFYWFSVPHDRLFLDALERDIKREKMGQEPTTQVVGEPALSFTYDPKRTLYEQFSKAQGGLEGEGELEAAVRRAEEVMREGEIDATGTGAASSELRRSSPSSGHVSSAEDESGLTSRKRSSLRQSSLGLHQAPSSPFFNMFSLFEGSPNYKQRRKKQTSRGSNLVVASTNTLVGEVSQSFPSVKNEEDDMYGEMSAAALFESQTTMGRGVSKQEQAKRQAENQRIVQAQHLAALRQSQGSMDQVSQQSHSIEQHTNSEPFYQGLSQQQQLYSSPIMHTSLVSTPSPMMNSTSILGDSHGEHHRNTLPMASEHHHHSHGTNRHAKTVHGSDYTTMTSYAYNPSTSNGDVGSGSVSATMTIVNGSSSSGTPQTTKAFVCPLFSCGRLFKRMEHLKRHLRTHTMERPFQCPVCHKRFSRSDNLSQHIRTHTRDHSHNAASTSNALEGAVPTESEEILENQTATETYGDALGLVMNDLDMCEVDVAAATIQDINGDEEGLVTTTQPIETHYTQNSEYFQAVNAHFGQILSTSDGSPDLMSMQGTQLQADENGVQWATATGSAIQHSSGYDLYGHSQPSPAYTTVSTSSPQPFTGSLPVGMAPLVANASDTYQPYAVNQIDYVAMSAPSHKQNFDHSSLYPPEINLSQSAPQGPGPVRRFRSMTPTVVRDGDSIRRPLSSSGMGDFGTNSSAYRAYHPYASAMSGHYSNSSAGSSHSSPTPYESTVDYTQQQRHGMMRHDSHSRSSSSQLQDQSQPILNLEEVDPDLAYPDQSIIPTPTSAFSSHFYHPNSGANYMTNDSSAY